jgi:GrpB-like predicted nucleotidyltransferase (UPF0157 family)
MRRFAIREPSSVQVCERERVLRKLKNAIPNVDSHEVGSSSVTGVIGKEDVDIVVLACQTDFDRVRDVLDTCFRRDVDQMSSDIYQGYVASDKWDVAVQLTVKGGPHDVFDRFARLLRKSAELREAYNALKREWDGRDMDEYRLAKAAFIAEALDRRS